MAVRPDSEGEPAGLRTKAPRPEEALELTIRRDTFVAGKEYIGARGSADGVAVGVHLEKVFPPAPRQALDGFGLGSRVLTQILRRIELVAGVLHPVLGVEMKPYVKVTRIGEFRHPTSRLNVQGAVRSHLARPRGSRS